MANQEHLDRLLQEVEAWNQWRELSRLNFPDFSGADLSEVFTDADFSGANFIFADFSDANLDAGRLHHACLQYADFSDAHITGADFSGADLTDAYFGRANLTYTDFSGAALSGADFNEANLSNTDFIRADLFGANLFGANLIRANFSGADLSHANLSTVQALDASFQTSTLTGACIQDWNINSDTNLQDVICEYVFARCERRTNQFTDRRPHDRSKTFALGEFVALVQKSLETVDLIFIDGIDWKAFFLSFQQLQEKYRNDNLGIQAIEKKPDGAFVIRLEVAPDADKAAIEQDSKVLYETQLKALEAQYQQMLRIQGDSLEEARRTIEYERQRNTELAGIVGILARNQGSTYNMQGSNFGGGMAAGGGIQSGGTLNDFSTDQDGSGS